MNLVSLKTIGDGVRYRIKVVRDMEFQIDIDAISRSDALGKVMRTAIDCDSKDQKETKIVRISEAPIDVLYPSN